MEPNITQNQRNWLFRIINKTISGEHNYKDLLYLRSIKFVDITISDEWDITYKGAEYLLEYYPIQVNKNYQK